MQITYYPTLTGWSYHPRCPLSKIFRPSIRPEPRVSHGGGALTSNRCPTITSCHQFILWSPAYQVLVRRIGNLLGWLGTYITDNAFPPPALTFNMESSSHYSTTFSKGREPRAAPVEQPLPRSAGPAIGRSGYLRHCTGHLNCCSGHQTASETCPNMPVRFRIALTRGRRFRPVAWAPSYAAVHRMLRLGEMYKVYATNSSWRAPSAAMSWHAKSGSGEARRSSRRMPLAVVPYLHAAAAHGISSPRRERANW